MFQSKKPATLASLYFPPGLSYGLGGGRGEGDLPPGTAQQIPSPQALTYFSHRASEVGEPASSGSQLLASRSEAFLDPKARLSLPRDGLLPLLPPESQTPQKETLPKHPPIYPSIQATPEEHHYISGASQELPASHLGPFGRGLRRRATPNHLLGQETPKAETPSSRVLSRRLQHGPRWRTSELLSGLCPTPPAPRPLLRISPSPVRSPRRISRRLFPSLTNVPSPGTPPASRS